MKYKCVVIYFPPSRMEQVHVHRLTHVIKYFQHVMFKCKLHRDYVY